MSCHYVADESLLIFLDALNLLGDIGNELVYFGALGIKVGNDGALFREGWNRDVMRFDDFLAYIRLCTALRFFDEIILLIYENIEGKFRSLGAIIKRVNE